MNDLPVRWRMADVKKWGNDFEMGGRVDMIFLYGL